MHFVIQTDLSKYLKNSSMYLRSIPRPRKMDNKHLSKKIFCCYVSEIKAQNSFSIIIRILLEFKNDFDLSIPKAHYYR